MSNYFVMYETRNGNFITWITTDSYDLDKKCCVNLKKLKFIIIVNIIYNKFTKKINQYNILIKSLERKEVLMMFNWIFKQGYELKNKCFAHFKKMLKNFLIIGIYVKPETHWAKFNKTTKWVITHGFKTKNLYFRGYKKN